MNFIGRGGRYYGCNYTKYTHVTLNDVFNVCRRGLHSLKTSSNSAPRMHRNMGSSHSNLNDLDFYLCCERNRRLK